MLIELEDLKSLLDYALNSVEDAVKKAQELVPTDRNSNYLTNEMIRALKSAQSSVEDSWSWIDDLETHLIEVVEDGDEPYTD